MIDLKSLGVIWGVIKKRGNVTVEELKNILVEENPQLIEKLEDMLLHLYKLYMIDYDGKNITAITIIDEEIAEVPCFGCSKVKTCKPGSKNNPFRCDKFVKWFIKKFTE